MSRRSASLGDDLVFLDEAPPPKNRGRGSGLPPWRIMIVDDDQDVHSATSLALANIEMYSRPLEFVHAYSATQAREVLRREKDIAVILLDVVMEEDNSGLELVHHIRESLMQSEVRIILRTGQPGYAPELDAIRDYDINDYKTKSELTRTKLYTTVMAAIRAYEQIRTINANRRGLDRIVRASSELMGMQTIEAFSARVIAQLGKILESDAGGLICAQARGSTDGPLVIAAAGLHAKLLGGTLHPARHPRLAPPLERVLDLRHSMHGPDYAALYLGGNANQDYAALIDTSGGPLTETERCLLDLFCQNVAVGLDNVLLLSRLHRFAFNDPLTKLPNRTRLNELISETIDGRPDADTTLALVDIDHFSETNDALGHKFGDRLLLGVASRMTSHFGDRLTVSRIGADTFGVLGNAALVNPAALLDLFVEPFSIDGQEVRVSATTGLVRLKDYESDASDVLKDADIALKHAKRLQRAGHFYFSRSMGVEVRERVRMMHALRTAYEEKELFVVYQPQVELRSRRPVGAEALLRWKTKDGSYIPPDRFIPIAEFSGLIIDIGERVMREACLQLVRLQAMGFSDFTMSINVSQVQFRHSRFLDMLRAVLADTQAPPSRIELEITESIAMEEPDVLIQLLGQIKETGVSIAIDDFGTGFSSLSYLQRLQADRLKIDRGFVTEITHSARGSSIAEMVIQLGRNLGLSIVAEGVEDERQASILSALGCPLAQGYLFAHPMTIDQLTVWLKEHGAY
jgi:diguanylate cyclase